MLKNLSQLFYYINVINDLNEENINDVFNNFLFLLKEENQYQHASETYQQYIIYKKLIYSNLLSKKQENTLITVTELKNLGYQERLKKEEKEFSFLLKKKIV